MYISVTRHRAPGTMDQLQGTSKNTVPGGPLECWWFTANGPSVPPTPTLGPDETPMPVFPNKTTRGPNRPPASP